MVEVKTKQWLTHHAARRLKERSRLSWPQLRRLLRRGCSAPFFFDVRQGVRYELVHDPLADRFLVLPIDQGGERIVTVLTLKQYRGNKTARPVAEFVEQQARDRARGVKLTKEVCGE